MLRTLATLVLILISLPIVGIGIGLVLDRQTQAMEEWRAASH